MKGTYFILISIVIGVFLGVYVTTNSTDLLETQSKLTPKLLIKNGSPEIGDLSARITIVEFGDYQCTFCYKFHQNTLKQIYEQYIMTGQVKYVYRDFPLNGVDSKLAAEASYCADDQNKYWKYHNILFENWTGENTGWISMNSLMKFAVDIDLDISEFNKCLNDHKYSHKVINNQNYAKSVGIDATPSFLIFDDKQLVRIIGAQSLERFQYALNQFN